MSGKEIDKGRGVSIEHFLGDENLQSHINLTNQRLFDVSSKIAVVTGGSRGIGLMIATGLVQNGATVYISSRKKEVCDGVAKSLTKLGPGQCYSFPFDLSTEEGCKSLASSVLAHSNNKIHILVNNSGISWGEDLFGSSWNKGWDKVLNLNLKSAFFTMRSFLPALSLSGSKLDPGRIINIGSIAGLRSGQSINSYSYDVSKAALHHLTRKVSSEFAARNVTCNCVAPGFVPSSMADSIELMGPDRDSMRESIPLGRMGLSTGEDMAGVVLFLSSKSGAWVTGAVIPVDGGTSSTTYVMGNYHNAKI